MLGIVSICMNISSLNSFNLGRIQEGRRISQGNRLRLSTFGKSGWCHSRSSGVSSDIHPSSILTSSPHSNFNQLGPHSWENHRGTPFCESILRSHSILKSTTFSPGSSLSIEDDLLRGAHRWASSEWSKHKKEGCILLRLRCWKLCLCCWTSHETSSNPVGA
jgi:hypothetical protein